MTRPLAELSALFFDANTEQPRCRLLTDAHTVWVLPHTAAGNAHEQLFEMLEDIQAAAHSGFWVAMSLSYEAGQLFSASDGLTLTQRPSALDTEYATPFLQAVAFRSAQQLTRAQALAYLNTQACSSQIHLDRAQSCIDSVAFYAQVDSIQSAIAAGQTYQVNLTFPYRTVLRAFTPSPNLDEAFQTSGTQTKPTASESNAALYALFAQLVEPIQVAYAALMFLPERTVLSCSPELFVQLSPDAITVRPMKGTAPISSSTHTTQALSLALSSDPKNRAENLMIVDLMRNDVSKVPGITKVIVPDIFTVKPYGAILQMTSTVQGLFAHAPRLTELFDALFPCGSITGAPKRETMRLIHELEPYARGTYCGALGFITSSQNYEPQHPKAHEHTLSMVLNVAIRTLELPAHPHIDALGIAHWPIQCSVGAGITYDSDAHDEWQECLLKSQFLTRHTQTFELIETICLVPHPTDTFTPQYQPWPQYAALHKQRMSASNQLLGFVTAGAFASAYDTALSLALRHAADFARSHAPQHAATHWPKLRLRLSLDTQGGFRHDISLLNSTPDVLLFDFTSVRTHSQNPILAHKTTMRAPYQRAWQQAHERGLFDRIFTNESGQVTEGARSCLYVQLNGQWYTPPLTCGVLPSVARHHALNASSGWLQERVLYPEDVRHAQACMLGNALYGLKPAQWIGCD